MIGKLLCLLGFHRWSPTPYPHCYMCVRCGTFTAGHL